jgi:hypothetical protein
MIFCGGDAQGNLVSLAIERVTRNTAQVKACVWFQDGRKFETFEGKNFCLRISVGLEDMKQSPV